MQAHILEGSGGNIYQVVLHIPAIAGSNNAGVTWKNAMIFSGRAGKTIMSVGNNPGQITQQESNDISQGNVWEIVRSIGVDPNLTGNALVNAILELGQIEIDNYKASVQLELKNYGLKSVS